MMNYDAVQHGRLITFQHQRLDSYVQVYNDLHDVRCVVARLIGEEERSMAFGACSFPFRLSKSMHWVDTHVLSSYERGKQRG